MDRSSIEAVLAHERDKAGVTDRRRTNSLGRATDQRERLRAFRAQGDDHPATGRELFDERRRDLGAPGRDEDRVVRRIGAPPQCAVADQDGDVGDARSTERRLSGFGKRAYALDRKYLLRERG